MEYSECHCEGAGTAIRPHREILLIIFCPVEMGLSVVVVPTPNVELSKDLVHYLHLCLPLYCLSRWAFWCHVIHSDADGKTSSFSSFFYYPPFFTENELITLSTLPAKAVYLHLSRNGSLLAHHYSGLLVSLLSNPYEHTENFSSIVNLQMLREKYGMLMDRQAENVTAILFLTLESPVECLTVFLHVKYIHFQWNITFKY